MQIELFNGNCMDQMLFMADNSVDSIVTDPPYGLSFMGKKWDYDVPSVDIWAECLRVLKPGGHLLAFSGTRTQHRMAVRIEDAGFEIRDMIAWVYGSGFPKSMDVSKAIDKAAGVEREVLGTVDPRGTFDGRERKSAAVNTNWRGAEGRDDVRDLSQKQITAPATEAARQWQGWGTALKPALEPVTVARKPLVGTVAANVLAHGTGALNIDGCRVGMSAEDAAYIGERIGGFNATRSIGGNGAYSGGEAMDRAAAYDASKGRWPANLIHDGSDEVIEAFPVAKGQQGAISGLEPSSKTDGIYGEFSARAASTPRVEVETSAARFFYCAKASKKDRGEGNNHPTVKPTDLMRYLCRLVTPPGGVVFDPFMGSGSTGRAALLEGFGFVGSEMEEAFFSIAKARIAAVQQGSD